LWDAEKQVAVRQATLPHPVISLSFHPTAGKLAAAAGTMLYLWDFENDLEPKVILQTKVSLRCVRFIDSGRLIVGVRSRATTAGITTYIRAARAQLLLYSFNEAAIAVGSTLTDPVVVVRRALLYNDAGLDVTSDNSAVLTCAEFWQPPVGKPGSPRAANDFVGGGDAEAGEQYAEEEDARHEASGDERVAHLIQVSLALPPEGQHFALDGGVAHTTVPAGGAPGAAAELPELLSPTTAKASPGSAPDLTPSGVAGRMGFFSAGASSSPQSRKAALAGQLIRNTSLEGLWAGTPGPGADAAIGTGTFVTSVKLSPTGEFVLLGCSRGNSGSEADGALWQHPVAAVWRLGDMQRMATLTSRTELEEEDDANVALFHPCPGAGVVYGTKQGQVACALNLDVLADSEGPFFPDVHEYREQLRSGHGAGKSGPARV